MTRHRLFALPLFVVLLGAAVLAGRGTGAQGEQYDLVLMGGRVLDPETGLDAKRNVGIRDGRIAAVTVEPLAARETLVVAGLVVAPGFIDLHAHGQDSESYRYYAHDGVTTALELEIGTYPVAPWYAERDGRALINYGVSIGHVGARRALITHDESLPGGARTRRGGPGHRVRYRVYARREPRGDPPRIPGRGTSRRALLRTLTRGRAGPGYRGQRGGAARGDRRRGCDRGFLARGPRDEHGPTRHTASPPAHSRRPRARPRCHDGSVPVHRGVHRASVRGVRSRLAAAHVDHLSRYPLSSDRRTPDPRQLRATPAAGCDRGDLPDSRQHGPTDARRLARDGGQ